MPDQRPFPPLLVACGMATFIAGLILPETFRAAIAEPAALEAARLQEAAVLPHLPEYVALPIPSAVVVTRDPFASAGERSAADEGGLPAFLPPNAGATGTPFPADLAPGALGATALLATALGRKPCALVSDSGSMRVVRVGDSLAGSTVAAVRLGAVMLEDGTTFRVGAR